jgi:hypothetical protein
VEVCKRVETMLYDVTHPKHLYDFNIGRFTQLLNEPLDFEQRVEFQTLLHWPIRCELPRDEKDILSFVSDGIICVIKDGRGCRVSIRYYQRAYSLKTSLEHPNNCLHFLGLLWNEHLRINDALCRLSIIKRCLREFCLILTLRIINFSKTYFVLKAHFLIERIR